MTDTNIAETAIDHHPLRHLAVRALGRSGADIERVVREARRKARRQKRPITWRDLEACLKGDERPMSADARQRVSIHEAGHAIVWSLLDVGEVISVMIGGDQLGQVMTRDYDHVPQTEDWLMKRAACILAGRAAEILVFENAVAGAGGGEDSDLARATRLALAAETTVGFSKHQPLLYRNPTGTLDLINRDYELSERVNTRLRDADSMAMTLLEPRRAQLTEIARQLEERGFLEGPEVRQVLGMDGKAGQLGRLDQSEKLRLP